MSGALLALCLAAAPALKHPDGWPLGAKAPLAASSDAPLQEVPGPSPAKKAAGTRCERCHSTEGWEYGRFPHEKTGFPLLGRHARTGCKQCHADGFFRPLPRGCAGCHPDPHAGELGARCEGCHEETGWQSRFQADAHRRTAFPLLGRHASLPCEECHGEMRERRFARAAVDCATCHLPDYARTSGTAVDHLQLGMERDCRRCHSAFAFAPARFPAHDACFEISAGPHAGIACGNCHTAVPKVPAVGACAQWSTACSSCHAHACAVSDRQHENVLGYECKDRKCYDCHQVSVRP